MLIQSFLERAHCQAVNTPSGSGSLCLVYDMGLFQNLTFLSSIYLKK